MSTMEIGSAAPAVALEESAQVSAEASQNMAKQAARHAQICNELGKMAPVGEVVVEYGVVGWQGICSPVRGIIVATTERSSGKSSADEQSGEQQNERFTRVLQPGRSREEITDPFIFDDLNKKAESWRATRKRYDGYTLPS